jgi:flagellar basal-body rod protein FlgB
MNPVQADRGFSLLSLALDGLTAQQQAIANNIANVETPGYQRQSIPFAEMMRRALNGADPGELAREIASGGLRGPGGRGDTREVVVAGKLNGNNVEIEREMTDLTENQVTYYAVAQAISNKIAVLREITTRAV